MRSPHLHARLHRQCPPSFQPHAAKAITKSTTQARPPNYGAKVQYAKPKDEPPPQVTRVFLFIGRVVDSTLLMPLSAIASEQANPYGSNDEKI